MTYHCRLGTSEDIQTLTPLWQAFLAERVAADPSMILKPSFDVAAYLQRQLSRPHTYAWLVEEEATAQIVGCLLIYFYDEAPPPGLPQDLQVEHELDNPFQPRRVGSVLGLYVQPEHRSPGAIQQLATAGLQMAEEIPVTDVDILVSAEQTGVHALLERSGFTRSAVQFTRHYALDPSAERVNPSRTGTTRLAWARCLAPAPSRLPRLGSQSPGRASISAASDRWDGDGVAG